MIAGKYIVRDRFLNLTFKQFKKLTEYMDKQCSDSLYREGKRNYFIDKIIFNPYPLLSIISERFFILKDNVANLQFTNKTLKR